MNVVRDMRLSVASEIESNYKFGLCLKENYVFD